MKGKTWITHDMLFCLCGWEEDVFLKESPNLQVALRKHRKTCDQEITRERAVVTKYESTLPAKD